MGSLEGLIEQPEQDVNVWAIPPQANLIFQPPDYLTDDKTQQVTHTKAAQVPKSVFEEEFEKIRLEFMNDSKQKNKLEFFHRIKGQNVIASVADIQSSVENLVKSSADKKLRRVYGAFVPVVEALKDYSDVIEVMSKVSLHVFVVRRC